MVEERGTPVPPLLLPLLLSLLLVPAGCWRVGEPRREAARVTWAAYPETVRVGETFSLEYAGPVADDSCGHMDSTWVSVGDSGIVLSARRRVYDQALCADQRVSFYEALPFRLDSAGRYPVRGDGARDLGTLVAVEGEAFSPMSAVGEGTLIDAGGCVLFGPGWAANQRPFALRGLRPELAGMAGSDEVVRVKGKLVGFSLCGTFGSRPSIRVEEAAPTGRRAADWYDGP